MVAVDCMACLANIVAGCPSDGTLLLCGITHATTSMECINPKRWCSCMLSWSDIAEDWILLKQGLAWWPIRPAKS